MEQEYKKQEKKCLPVNYPMITTYTQHAHLLSILSNYDETYPWIFSNYIQLYINKDYKHHWGDFYFPFPYELRPSDTCKWIYTQKINRDMVDCKWGSIINYIVDNINSNNYVHSMVNCFYISNYRQYQKKHFNHDILIYGYDMNEKVLFVSDFFELNKYSSKKVSFLDFTQSFSSYNLSRNTDHLNQMVYSYKLHLDCDYEFSIHNIISCIKAYLSGSSPEYWEMYNRANKENIVFGMEAYATLSNYLCHEVSNNDSCIDIRPFYMLCDHKRLMSLRIKFLCEQEYLKKTISGENIFLEIENKAKTVVNLIIKYNISKNKVILKRASEMLSDISVNEYKILTDIFDSYL